MGESLDTVLARATSDADALRRHGEARTAASLEHLAAAVAASDDVRLLAWVPEPDAMTRTGKGIRWFRERRAAWVRHGLARQGLRARWEYRACVLLEAGRVAEPDTRLERVLHEIAS